MSSMSCSQAGCEAIQGPEWCLPLITYAPRGGGVGGGQVSHTFPLRIQTCVLRGGKKVDGFQIACKIVYVLNGRPLAGIFYRRYMLPTWPFPGAGVQRTGRRGATSPSWGARVTRWFR